MVLKWVIWQTRQWSWKKPIEWIHNVIELGKFYVKLHWNDTQRAYIWEIHCKLGKCMVLKELYWYTKVSKHYFGKLARLGNRIKPDQTRAIQSYVDVPWYPMTTYLIYKRSTQPVVPKAMPGSSYLILYTDCSFFPNPQYSLAQMAFLCQQ